jgi:Domain of unknown function (DUF4270)
VKKFAYYLFGAAILIFVQQACTKVDTTSLGANLIPVVDNISTFDTTLTVFSSNTFLPDSSRVTRTSEHALGVVEDPVFGKTHADIYFDILPTTLATHPFINRDSVAGIDSVVLSLAYRETYGDSNAVENFKVYEVSPSAPFVDSIPGYSISTPDIAVQSQVLGETTVNFTTLNDARPYKFKTDTTPTTNQLHILLDKNLGLRFKNYDTATVYKNDTLFRSAFRGLAIKTDESQSSLRKALAYFDLSNTAATYLRVYYRTVRNGVADTLSTDFNFRTYANANIVKRTITGTPYETAVNAAGTNKDVLYLESSPGSQAMLSIPGLKNLDNRVIHKAELIIPIIESNENTTLTPPKLLFLERYDSLHGRYTTLKNDFQVNATTSPISYNFQTLGGYQTNGFMNFDISRQVQQIVTNKFPVTSFRLSAPYTAYPQYFPNQNADTVLTALPSLLFVNYPVAYGRVVVGGGSNVDPAKRLRLRIIYSKI